VTEHFQKASHFQGRGGHLGGTIGGHGRPDLFCFGRYGFSDVLRLVCLRFAPFRQTPNVVENLLPRVSSFVPLCGQRRLTIGSAVDHRSRYKVSGGQGYLSGNSFGVRRLAAAGVRAFGFLPQ
jgi:hypothetical protein